MATVEKSKAASPTTDPLRNQAATAVKKEGFINGLLSPMSLTDQEWAATWCGNLIYGAGLVSFPAAFYLESFQIITVIVLSTAALCCILFVPNWRQTPDEKIDWVDDDTAAAYYDKLEKAREKELEHPKKKE